MTYTTDPKGWTPSMNITGRTHVADSSAALSALAERIYRLVCEHGTRTISWQGNVAGDYERALAEHESKVIGIVRDALAASAPVAVSPGASAPGAAGDGDIIRGMVALTHIGWAPDLRYDDDGRWKIQADSFCELPWHDSPREAWEFFVRERLKDEPEARAALESTAKPPAQEKS